MTHERSCFNFGSIKEDLGAVTFSLLQPLDFVNHIARTPRLAIGIERILHQLLVRYEWLDVMPCSERPVELTNRAPSWHSSRMRGTPVEIDQMSRGPF